MSKAYWLTLKIKGGVEPKITHSTPVSIKLDFDENYVQTKGKYDRTVASSEHSIPYKIDINGMNEYSFNITEKEYNTKTFGIYIWGEPYGYVALRHKEAHEGLAVGRLTLEAEHCTKKIIAETYQNFQKGDEEITCEFEIVQSVVNYMADEMNTNINNEYVKNIKRERDKAKDVIRKFSESSVPHYRPSYEYYEVDKAIRTIRYLPEDFACLVHSNSNKFTSGIQDVVLCGGITPRGGMWDHKPKIIKIWGTRNRLGNDEYIYYYDNWSNIHYGYIGKSIGFSDTTLLEGASKAQFWDIIFSTEDDPVDKASIIEGIKLNNKKTIKIDDLINIYKQHPEWDSKTRFGK